MIAILEKKIYNVIRFLVSFDLFYGPRATQLRLSKVRKIANGQMLIKPEKVFFSVVFFYLFFFSFFLFLFFPFSYV